MLGLPFLLTLGLSLAAAAMPMAHCTSAEKTLRDRIQGAILGSALGDALARGTSLLDTQEEIQGVYGSNGLTTMKSFTPQDWVKEDTALYTHNSVISSMMLTILLEARKKQTSKESIADHIGRKMIELFGLKNKEIDPLFDERYHTMENRHIGEQLATLFKHKNGTLWWSPDVKKNGADSAYQGFQESDSSAIMRAWPVGLIFSEDIANVKLFADYQALITHHNPTVRAASVALAVGVAYALQGASIDMVVNQMVKSAAQYDQAERLYKPHAKKVLTRRHYNPDALIKNEMLTSDMIRYAADMAQLGKKPDKILGTTNKKQENNRSFRGFLLGYEADEAVAAAVYIFVRHGNDLKSALIEGANAYGRTSLIASLAGVLVGARTGIAQLKSQGFEYELAKLENREDLENISEKLLKVLKEAVLSQEAEGSITRSRNVSDLSYTNGTSIVKRSSCSNLCKVAVGFGLIALGGWLTYKYIVPRITGQTTP